MTSTEKQPLSKKRKLEKLSSSSSSKSGKSSAAGDTVAAVKKGPSFEQDLKKLAEDSPISKVTLADALIALGKAVSADEDDQFGLDDSQIDGVLVAMSAICSGVPSVSSKKASEFYKQCKALYEAGANSVDRGGCDNDEDSCGSDGECGADEDEGDGSE